MKISVIITAYNVKDFIAESIKSVLEQTYNDIEVIVVEDCSTDGTIDILKKCDDPRVRIIYNNKNVGAGGARRIGIEQATGDYILLLDGDDWLQWNFIQDLVYKAEGTQADVVSGGITIKHEDGVTDTTSYGDRVVEGPDKVFKFWKERIVFMNNKLIRKELFQKVPYCTRRYIEDTPTIIPILYFANKVAYTDNVGYVYRMRNESLTHKANAFKNALFRALCAKDLIIFFSDKESEYSKFIDLNKAYMNELINLKNSGYSKEDINQYKDEFLELMMFIFENLNVK